MLKKIWAVLTRSTEEPTASLEEELNDLPEADKEAIAEKYSPEPEMPQPAEEEEITIEVPEDGAPNGDNGLSQEDDMKIAA